MARWGLADAYELATNAGASYVYVRSGTTWSQQAYIKASNAGEGDIFGIAITLSDGNTLAVGAVNEASSTTGINSTPDELAGRSGAAYVFIRSGTDWTQQSYVKASNTGINDSFGRSISLSGDGNTLSIGANGENSAQRELIVFLTICCRDQGLCMFLFGLLTFGYSRLTLSL